jgi:hypothetical protein
MMKGVGSLKVLFENLDLTPTHSILWTDIHIDAPRRPVEHDPNWDLKALMFHQLLQNRPPQYCKISNSML